jgi:hypothetical protein
MVGWEHNHYTTKTKTPRFTVSFVFFIVVERRPKPTRQSHQNITMVAKFTRLLRYRSQ